ncbi:Transmembrane nucleoporin, variant 2 [Entomophthora muscae]|nr:Transmembrane nucleoporin, variant 2 [Entomophthora muscae]
MQYAARLVSDENFSYGFLAFYWLLLDPIAVTLIPFTLFTVIHYVSYFRNQLLPALYPQVPKELKTRASPPSKQAQVALMLDDLTRRYAAPAIRMATMSEVTLVPVVLILLALTFRISFVSLFSTDNSCVSVPFNLLKHAMRFRKLLLLSMSMCFNPKFLVQSRTSIQLSKVIWLLVSNSHPLLNVPISYKIKWCIEHL